MKLKPFFAILFLFPGLVAAEGESPDGRFRFEAFSSEEVDSGRRPAFGIIEVSTGNLVSDPAEPLGDASRPEETILWAPDSLSYALTSRVGTRHLDSFLYRWDGKAFVRATWEGAGRIEALADDSLEADIAAQGLPKSAGLGQCLRGDDLPERWLDPSRLILSCIEEYSVGDEHHGGIASGNGRAIVRWDEASHSYQIERELLPTTPWPARVEDAGAYELIQEDKGGEESLKVITVKHRETGKSHRFEAENHLTSPIPLAHANDRPQLELVSRGPEGFEMRRLFRFTGSEYRCVRILELTHLVRQAQEDAPLFEIEAGYTAAILRDRVVAPDDPVSYESFQTESPSPDGKWKAVFTYHLQCLQRVEIVPADGIVEPTVIHDFDEGLHGPDTTAEPLWSPDGSALAVYLQDGPRVGSTLLYREHKRVWSEAEMPEIDYAFLKEALEQEIPWGQQLVQPIFWKSPRELVVDLVGHFRGDRGFDYRAIATLSWDELGKPLACVSVETESN